MWSSILSLVAQPLFYLLDWWMKKQNKDKEMTESYYNFLKQVDKSGATKVKNYLTAEEALKAKQEELKKELDAQSKTSN